MMMLDLMHCFSGNISTELEIYSYNMYTTNFKKKFETGQANALNADELS